MSSFGMRIIACEVVLSALKLDVSVMYAMILARTS